MTNEKYTGEFKFGGRDCKNIYPAIVDKALFLRVQEKLAENKYVLGGQETAKVPYLLSGKVFCGHCGSEMVADKSTGKSGKKYSYYTCKKRQKHECDKLRENKDNLESYVTSCVVNFLKDKKNAEMAVDDVFAYYEKRTDEDNLRSISARIANIQSEAEKLADAFIEEQVALLRKQIGDKKVLLALSGGVDSSVVAALLIKAVGKQLVCVHVNHGLLRKGEPEQVIRVFKEEMDANLVYVDAVDRFLDKLAGVDDPETKRKIIGAEFIRVFEEEARKLEGIEFLAQGTIYPDIVESAGVKAHHNAGGLPDDLKFELVEPLRYLYKDEVRVVGKELGLPDGMVFRQPFPGPGLGVRCLGAITRDRLEAVRESDAILREEFAKAGLEGKVWQYFTAIPDFRSTGVKDGKRCFEWPVIVRAVNTVDAMTATVEPLDFAVLSKITDRILAEVKGVNRVVYDMTPKPCGTIEWE